MIKNLENKLKFIELIDEMKNIKRAVLLRNGRQETDAEHSYHLAMIVLVFAEDFPELNIEKCLKMALLHDLVEIFAGDTIFLVDSKEKIETKKQREQKAIGQLEKVLGKESFLDMKNLILEYENKSSLEAEFVYEIDKLQPLIQYVMEGGNGWHKWKYNKDKLIGKYNKIFNKDRFGLKKLIDKYFQKAENENMFY